MKSIITICSASLIVLMAIPAHAGLATYDASLPNPDPTAQSWTKSPLTVFLAPINGTRPPETGSFNAYNSGPPAAWEINDVQDDGDDADGMKSNPEYYFKSIGDQSNVDWVLSFTTSLRDGAYQDFVSQKTAQTNAFQYQAYEGLNGTGNPIWDIWRVEFAVVDNGNGTFDLAALGRESFSGAPAAIPGPSTVLLDNVSQATAEAFYSYELRYQSLTQEASLWLDSGGGMTQRLSGIMLDNSTSGFGSAGDSLVAWGSLTGLGGGHLLVTNVDFNAIPEPSAVAYFLLLSATLIAFGPRRSRLTQCAHSFVCPDDCQAV